MEFSTPYKNSYKQDTLFQKLKILSDIVTLRSELGGEESLSLLELYHKKAQLIAEKTQLQFVYSGLLGAFAEISNSPEEWFETIKVYSGEYNKKVKKISPKIPELIEAVTNLHYHRIDDMGGKDKGEKDYLLETILKGITISAKGQQVLPPKGILYKDIFQMLHIEGIPKKQLIEAIKAYYEPSKSEFDKLDSEIDTLQEQIEQEERELYQSMLSDYEIQQEKVLALRHQTLDNLDQVLSEFKKALSLPEKGKTKLGDRQSLWPATLEKIFQLLLSWEDALTQQENQALTKWGRAPLQRAEKTSVPWSKHLKDYKLAPVVGQEGLALDVLNRILADWEKTLGEWKTALEQQQGISLTGKEKAVLENVMQLLRKIDDAFISGSTNEMLADLREERRALEREKTQLAIDSDKLSFYHKLYQARITVELVQILNTDGELIRSLTKLEEAADIKDKQAITKLLTVIPKISSFALELTGLGKPLGKELEQIFTLYKYYNFDSETGNIKGNDDTIPNILRDIELLIGSFLDMEDSYQKAESRTVEIIKSFLKGEITPDVTGFLFRIIGQVDNDQIYSLLRFLVREYKIDLTTLKDDTGGNLLHRFIITQSLDEKILEMLLSNNFDLNAQNNMQETALHLLAKFLKRNCEILSKQYSEKNVDQKLNNKHYDFVKITKDLIVKGADVAIKNSQGQHFYNVLYTGTNESHADLYLQFLFTEEIINKLAETAPVIIDELLHMFADYTVCFLHSNIGLDPEVAHLKIFSLLVAQTRNINSADENGNTVLHKIAATPLELSDYLAASSQYNLPLDFTVINHNNETIWHALLKNQHALAILTGLIYPVPLAILEQPIDFLAVSNQGKLISDLISERPDSSMIIPMLNSILVCKILNKTAPNKKYLGKLLEFTQQGEVLLKILTKVYMEKVYQSEVDHQLDSNNQKAGMGSDELTETVRELIQKAETGVINVNLVVEQDNPDGAEEDEEKEDEEEADESMPRTEQQFAMAPADEVDIVGGHLMDDEAA